MGEETHNRKEMTEKENGEKRKAMNAARCRWYANFSEERKNEYRAKNRKYMGRYGDRYKGRYNGTINMKYRTGYYKIGKIQQCEYCGKTFADIYAHRKTKKYLTKELNGG